jgi:hypothetical protein
MLPKPNKEKKVLKMIDQSAYCMISRRSDRKFMKRLQHFLSQNSVNGSNVTGLEVDIPLLPCWRNGRNLGTLDLDLDLDRDGDFDRIRNAGLIRNMHENNVSLSVQIIIHGYFGNRGAHDSVVSWCTTLQAGRSRDRFPMMSLDGPGVDSVSNRNEYQESSWG